MSRVTTETRRSHVGTTIAMHACMARLAPAYSPRRPTETVLYGVVREHLETFLTHARDSYAKPIPKYVEREFRAYLNWATHLRPASLERIFMPTMGAPRSIFATSVSEDGRA